MMASRKFLSSQGSSDMPDLDSGALGFQTSVAHDIDLAGKVSTTMVERVKPPLPTKKSSHLNDLIRLRKELEESHEQKEQAEEMTDLMARDLCLAQDEVQEKDDQLRRKKLELKECEEELKNWREKVQSLSLEIQEEKRLAAEIQNLNRMHEVAITSKKEIESQNEEELSLLRGQVANLTTSLAEKQAQEESAATELADLRGQVSQLKSILNKKDAEMTEKLTTCSSQEQELRLAAESSLQSAKQQFEAELQKTTERAGVQIAELHKRALEAEASLQEHTNRMEVQVSHEPLLERISSLEAEVQNERQRYEWFKKNSENLSRKIKQAQAASKALEQSEYLLTRQLDDLKSKLVPKQHSRGVEHMPGTFKE